MTEVLAWVLVIVFIVLSLFFGKRLKDIVNVLKDIEDFIHKIYTSLEDGTLSYEEAKSIIEEVINLIEKYRRIL